MSRNEHPLKAACQEGIILPFPRGGLFAGITLSRHDLCQSGSILHGWHGTKGSVPNIHTGSTRSTILVDRVLRKDGEGTGKLSVPGRSHSDFRSGFEAPVIEELAARADHQRYRGGRERPQSDSGRRGPVYFWGCRFLSLRIKHQLFVESNLIFEDIIGTNSQFVGHDT